MRYEEQTRKYPERRTTEGKTRHEILRCLKRYIAREVHRLLTNPPVTPNTEQLHTSRSQADITTTQTAKTLNVHNSRITQPETGYTHNHQHWPPNSNNGSNNKPNNPKNMSSNIEASSTVITPSET